MPVSRTTAPSRAKSFRVWRWGQTEPSRNCDLFILATALYISNYCTHDIILRFLTTPRLPHQLPCTNSRPRKSNSSSTQLCRFFQYFSKYLGSVYQEINETQPHRRNEMLAKIKKTDTVWASMGLARKVLRFGPSINCLKTFILNIIQLSKGQNKEPTPIFVLKTLSALWIATFFICDHYLWCFRVPLGSLRWVSPRTKA